AKLIGIRDLEHRVPVDRRIVLRRRRIGRRRDRAEIQWLAQLAVDLRRIDEAVATDPHLVFGLRKVGHHVAALVVGDDDSRKPGRKLRRLGDDPDTGLGPARPGDHAADVVTTDGHRSTARLLGAELHDRAGPEHNDHKCRHPQPQRSLRLRHRATPFVASHHSPLRARMIHGGCPEDERARLAGSVPPMDGSEYVDADWIDARWADLNRALADEIRAQPGSVADWLSARHPSWHVVGKVCLHLAENRADEEHPFAFLATYAARAGAGGKVQHRPLARALEESSARGDRKGLLHLLVPLQRAAEQTEWLAELIDSGEIYHAAAC